ncbi:hypothetical protein M1307_00455 [Patescibacteria group bacterium]|nr:hypothetical protein [Patescibacteria group bacterium]
MTKLIALSVNGREILAPGKMPTGGAQEFPYYVGVIISAMFMVAIFFSLIMMVWGGLDWTMSSGNKEKLQTAKNKIKFAFIGLAVSLLAYAVVDIFLGAFGITGLFK